MKKSISLFQSLLLVALVAPSCLLSMDQQVIPTPAQKKEAREKKQGNRTPLNVSSDTIPKEQAMILVQANPLNDTVLPTILPSKRGLSNEGWLVGLTSWGSDKMFGQDATLLSLLRNKTFNPDNQSCHTKLNSGVTALVEKKDSASLIEVLELCYKDHGASGITIAKVDANIAHKFLVDTKTEKQTNLKNNLNQKTKVLIEQQNSVLAKLQQHIKESIATFNQNFKTYNDEKDTLTAVECAEIIALKATLLNLHKLCPELKTDGYCSDAEEQKSERGKTLYKNPIEVKTFYSIEYILSQKLNITTTLNETNQKMDRTLRKFNELNESIQNTPALRQ